MRYFEINEKSNLDRKKDSGTHSDQFFTRPEVAKLFSDWVKSQPFYKEANTIIEPSAGNKDIAHYFPGATLYDLDPKHSDILRQDWLKYNHFDNGRTLVVGNPPFGKNNTLAIKFINKAAEFADWIAFILPKGFKRIPTQNRISTSHSLYSEIDLPKNSFYLPDEEGDKPYDVPAVAQIWHRKNREKQEISYNSQWVKFTSPEDADIAVKRAGKLGSIDVDKSKWNTHSHRQYHYLKLVKNPEKVINFIKTYDWNKIGDNTVAAPVITKFDLINTINQNLSD
jgi:hypothetical protein